MQNQPPKESLTTQEENGLHESEMSFAGAPCGKSAFDIPLEAFTLCKAAGVQLVQTDDGLTLTDGTLSLCPNFEHALARTAPGKLSKELLIKAAKLKILTQMGSLGAAPMQGANYLEAPRVIDATAGLGEDAFLMAATGARVDLYESNPVIAALLGDALRRAAADERTAEMAARMTLHAADSVAALAQLDFRPAVIYLDPMFPGRTKTAAVKKKFQLLHRIEQPADAAAQTALLEAALAAQPRKVIVKRPAKGPYLAERRPDYSLSGKAVRYDVFAFA